jgi:hypothetical protein
MDRSVETVKLGGMVNFTERALRDLLCSPYGKNCGESMLDGIEKGRVVTVQMSDGSTLTMQDRPTAVLMLREFFQWQLVP